MKSRVPKNGGAAAPDRCPASLACSLMLAAVAPASGDRRGVRASNRRARAASPRSSMRAAFALRTAARSASPASSRSRGKGKRRLGAVGDRRRARGDACTAKTTRPTATAASPPLCSSTGSETPVQAQLLAQGEALVSAEVTDKDCAAVLTAAEGGGAAGQKGNLGRSRRHKKRGKSGRYFGRDWAFYGGRGQGFVGPAGRGNDLPEFRTELDTGLCCDYFKAHDTGIRGCRACCLSPSKIDGFVSAAGSRRAAGRESKCSGWGRLKCSAGISVRWKFDKYE